MMPKTELIDTEDECWANSIVVVYGSWKLRHNEVSSTADEDVHLYSLPTENIHGAISYRFDFRTALRGVGKVTAGEWVPSTDGASISGWNLSESQLPLALIKFFPSRSVKVLALLSRVEVHACHFLAVEGDLRPSPISDIPRSLARLFDIHHLKLANFECYHFPITQKDFSSHYVLPSGIDSLKYGLKFLEELQKGSIKGFFPALGREFEQWAFHSTNCITFSSAVKEQCLLSSMNWSRRRKRSLDEKCFTLRRVVFKEPDVLPNGFDLVDGDKVFAPLINESPEVVLAVHWQHSVKRCVDAYETCFSAMSESTSTGAIYSVEFSSVTPTGYDAYFAPYVYCEIRPQKARHPIDEDLVREDMSRIARCFEAFLSEADLPFTKDNCLFQAVKAPFRSSTYTSQRQMRIAVIGPSGSGKSTVSSLIKDTLETKGYSVSVQKLAAPLYILQRKYYEIAGLAIAEGAQNQLLMESIAEELRRISPSVLVDNLSNRLEATTDDVVINDDLRDDEVDWPALEKMNFFVVRIFTDEQKRLARLKIRSDITTSWNSELDNQVRRIRSDFVILNNGSIDDLQSDVTALIDSLLTEF